MAFPIAWILNKMGQKMYAWSSTKAVMDFDRGGEKGQLLQETLKNLENNSISVYTHSKTGTVHEFSGTGVMGRALMTADVKDGDTFTVNGTPVTAYMGTEDATDSMAGSPWNGKWVSFVYDGITLNFKGASGGLKPGHIVFAAGFNNMNGNTFTPFNSPYFVDGVCQKACNVDFFVSVGYNAAQSFNFSVTVNGEVKLTTTTSTATPSDLTVPIGSLSIAKGDVVSGYWPISSGGSNQRGGAIIGVLA